VEWQPIPSSAEPIDRRCVDAQHAHHRALARSDEIVQQLAVAKYALSIGEPARAMVAIDAALDFARQTLSDLLDLVSPPEATSYAGSMVRSLPAQLPPPAPPERRPATPAPRIPTD
jgi:hypothetical protein